MVTLWIHQLYFESACRQADTDVADKSDVNGFEP